jgi:UDP-N-acetyl-D-glucosamine dehydrogenase
LENTFRSVNIGLVNEMALICYHLGISIWEVIDAAATKPFGFTPFYPGPGIGGHCIPLDPFYLAWKARLNGYEARFIGLAGEVNSSMPRHVVELASDALNEERKCVNGSRVLVLGVAYKRDVTDVRESPAQVILDLLHKKGAVVSYSDPLVPHFSVEGVTLESVPLTPAVQEACDFVITVTDHSAFDYDLITLHAPLLVDTRHATGGLNPAGGRIIYL